MAFIFDKNDVFSQADLMGKLSKLNGDRNYYLSEIENNKREIEELKTNKVLKNLHAKKYHMKKITKTFTLS